jgi:hypothetical protein
MYGPLLQIFSLWSTDLLSSTLLAFKIRILSDQHSTCLLWTFDLGTCSFLQLDVSVFTHQSHVKS